MCVNILIHICDSILPFYLDPLFNIHESLPSQWGKQVELTADFLFLLIFLENISEMFLKYSNY